MRVAPAAVWDALADARAYGDWVVGSSAIRDSDEHWPAPGTSFHHSVGSGPLVIRDRSTVVNARPPVMLELIAHARPLPSARVTMHLQPEGDGTRVTMIEDPDNRLLTILIGPLGHALMRLRNAESLRRLKALAEERY
jgi:uncharacterized protein YndB with AHSA1/START domain